MVDTGGYTGKVSWNLGKKYGLSSCTLHLPHTDNDDDEGDDTTTTTNNNNSGVKEEEVEEFWVALETAANKLLIQSANSNNDNGDGDGSSSNSPKQNSLLIQSTT